MGSTYKNFEDAYVICPFYKGLARDGRTLRCEGAVKSSTMSHKFITAEKREGHMEKYCKSFSYEKCPISRMLDQKYTAV